ncbi:acyclic terpene utilization AtuA family protein [Bradyrhizobium zhanjiangense]|uniref:ABC transporter substrate-binding protein n=1 Tax=Bradyrhizobium zhanjiangense TaxID=1325107 RepID=A0A4Q0SPA0_9BRAD|nr:acyclic terpene utilization AtuA family protein [Bradyrhizobium zhanjiangense]RXH41735.1 ABC transporter substrate-binding protein [Bradyrhizobium zhanjiangense]
MKTIRIGCGAGFSGDRIEPAVELAERGALHYLGFECLAERTTALAQQARRRNPAVGFDPLLIARFKAVLPAAVKNRVRIITNMGAANPLGAAKAVAAIARDIGFANLKIAAVEGDDVLDHIAGSDLQLIERQGRVSDLAGRIVSANAYLGVGPIIEALAAGSDIVVTGRVSDPALFAAPLIHEFGLEMEDWDRLGQSMVIGHLLECSSQVTGGYFADPGYKNVANLARIGFPLADVREDGSAILTKVEGSGGEVSLRTCKEQLLYEVHDPAAYIQPDVVANFSTVSFEQVGPNRVAISGGSGQARTDTLKVTIGYLDSYVGEGQISYAGSGARARGQLALDIVEERLKLTGVPVEELRLDTIGVNAVHRGAAAGSDPEPAEVRIRVIGRTRSMTDAIRIGNEVESLWLSGPAGGGGATKSAREVIAAASTLLSRDVVKPRVSYEVV